jgi:hypothetical protein
MLASRITVVPVGRVAVRRQPGLFGVLALAMFSLLAPHAAFAFDPPEDTAGPLTVRIEGPSVVEKAGEAVPLRVVFVNGSNEPIEGSIELKSIDGWLAEPAQPTPFSVPANGETSLDGSFTPAPNSYAALYPVHAYARFTVASQSFVAHPVLIVEARVPEPPRATRSVPWQPYVAASNGQTRLSSLPVYRVVLAPDGDGAPKVLAPGWQGEESQSRASVLVGSSVSRGGERASLAMHPPWQGDAYRSVLAEFPLRLPETRPLMLRFGVAIRDHVPDREPASDGVTFRVRVAPFDAPDGALGEVLFERHADTKVWQDEEVSLEAFAGQSVRLQFESHPGPANDTACDQSYWGAPTLVTGSGEATPSAPAGPPHVLGWLQGAFDSEVTVTLGARGLLDAIVRFGNEPEALSFRGFDVRVLGDNLSWPESLARLVSVEMLEADPSHYHVRHRFESWMGPFDLIGELWLGWESLRTRFRLEGAPEAQPWQVVYIENIAVGPWNRLARRVYAGPGNVLEQPGAFRIGFDGHRLSTSFVGFEFDNVSMVQAVDLPPEALEVNPESRTYSLHVPHAATITFIPTTDVWQGARTWHDVNGMQPAPGIDKLAGRFVFDLWGGRYAESAEALARAFRYGLTDAVVVWHNWQRWGYDYRLPDIYPPNPKLGTSDEFQALIETCKRNGVLFAPHDNYIDYYPDAEGYSYDAIAFTGDGRPMRAWLNEGRGAQAYRWRPDRVHAVVERNLRLIHENLAPDAYFIDVWSSAGPHDYWTREGRFYDRVYTRNVWASEFDWIRRLLGNNAPQISESGHDQLIGHLDGAQANHLRVRLPDEPKADPPWTVWDYPCADAERVPWFDAAHHDRFVLHGAGYENRYAGGLDARLHGIYSDDYIATEVLTGHPAMVPAPFNRQVVRKYWLLHDLMRALALQRIEGVTFAGTIHRQRVAWEGAEVFVNRGEDDWTVAGRTLPQFGFYARGPVEGNTTFEAAIERKGESIVEWSRSPASLYASVRAGRNAGIAVTAPEEPLRLVGDRAMELRLDWTTTRAPKGPARVFVHFVDGDGKIAFQADYDPETPVENWQGTQTHTVPVRLQESMTNLVYDYELRVGLYRPQAHERLPIDGWADGNRGIRLGKVRLEGDGARITGVGWQPLVPSPLLTRLSQPARLHDFGFAETDGAFRLTQRADGVYLTLLPEQQEPCTVRVRWKELPWEVGTPTEAVALDEAGNELERMPLVEAGGVVEVSCKSEVFAYRLR